MLCLLAFAPALRAANYYVDTAAQFNAGVDKNGAAFSTLYAGDRVYLKGGNWDGLIRTLTGSMSDAEARANPAIVYACDANYVPTIGGVTVNGLSQIQLAGSGIVFTGLTFSSSSGMYKVGNYADYSGGGGTAYIFLFRALSRYMTVSHIKFDHCGDNNTDYENNDHYGAWLLVFGYRHTIQYCEFEGRDFDPNDSLITNPALINRRKSIRDATVVIYKSDADTTDYGYHTVRYNYFGERKVPASNDPRLYAPADGSLTSESANGWEAIRVGNGSLVSVDLNTTVEYNSFYHAIQAVEGGVDEDTGEPEICSNKSRKNTYRYNTFLNSYGQLTLRNGDYAVVQGNYFLAGGAYDADGDIVLTEARNTRMGGVRVIGFGHTVANNYFYRLNSTGAGAALCLYQGFNDPGTLANLNNVDGSTNYETANYSQIIGNTFIDCKEINLDYKNDDPTESIYPIFATQFINNLVYYSGNVGASGVVGQNSDALTNHGGLARGNYVYSVTASQLGNAATMLGAAGNTITSSADPLLTSLYNDLPVPASNSPLLGAAAALPTINDTSAERAGYDLAGNVATYGGLDLRGLIRPANGRDIGAYEREAAGTGVRPLRRSEVGCVPATSPNPLVVSELFADGTRDATGKGDSPPGSLRWFCSGATAANTTVSATNGTMTLTTPSTRQAVAYFPVQSLAVGDLLSLSFNFSVTSPRNVSRGLRAGLLYKGINSAITSDSGANPTNYTGVGYGTFINPASTSAGPASLVERGTTSGTIVTTPVGTTWATNIATGGTAQSLVAGRTYTCTLTVRRTSASQVALTTTYAGGSLAPVTLSGTDNTGLYVFDTLALGVGNSTVGSISYSNIKLTKSTPLVARPGTANGALNTPVDVNLLPLVSSATSSFAALAFSVSSPVNGTVTLLSDGVTARFTPAAGYQGTANFSYSATDGTATASSSVGIAFANNAPTIADVSNQTINEDAATGAIAVTLGDDFTPAASLTLFADSSNTTLVPPANIVIGGSNANRTVTITPAPNQSGTSTITLTVSDGVLTASDTFVLTVNPVNDAPLANAVTATTALNQSVDVDLRALASDLETSVNDLIFSVTSATNGIAVLDADGHTVRFTPAAGYFGPATFGYTITDIAADARTLLNYTFQSPEAGPSSITNCLDASGNARHGTFSPLPLLSAGVATYTADYPAALYPAYDQSVQFYQNGNMDTTRLACGLSGTSVINLQTADWTVAGWFKRTSTPADQDIIFHLGDGVGNGGSGSELTLAFFASTPSSALTLRNWNSTPVSTSFVNDVSISTTASSGVWHHYAIVRSGSTISFYLNGAIVGTDTSFSFTFDPSLSPAFGAADGSTSTYLRAFNGSMADLAIFSAALSASEVTRLCTTPVARLGDQSAGNTVTVNVKRAGTVALGGLAQTYDSTPKMATATTGPGVYAVDFTYDGSSTPPTAAGAYAVVGTINDPNYAGSATGTLVVAKAAASVTLDGLAAIYDGTAKSVVAQTDPAGLAVAVTYDGSTNPPSEAGAYVVTGAINDINYEGSASGSLVISWVTASFTSEGLNTWVCPANVHNVRVECWGGGGAGGSAQRTGASGSVQFGGGGAGGAYAKRNFYPVIPGNTYYISVGAGGVNTSPITGTQVAGGDSWFNSTNAVSTNIIAKGGAGGASAIGNSSATRYGVEGTGTATASVGDVVYGGGSGAAGASTGAGGGGSSAGTGSSGTAALDSTGATAPLGGGNGGAGTLSTGGSVSGANGSTPGGGGGGTRSSADAVSNGGRGAPGLVVLTANTATPPTVDVAPPSSVTDTAATLGGFVNNDGGATITARGVVYAATAVNGNPQIGGPGVTNLTATGSTGGFTASAGNLAPGTAYTFCAYAMNSQGTTYTARGAFTTLTSLESWRQAAFAATANTGDAADSADPDGDGLTNVEEYDLGTDPKTADNSALPALSGGGSSFTFSFVARNAVGTGYAGLTRHYAVEVTTDLATPWSPLRGYSDIVGHGQGVTGMLPSDGGQVFLRLKSWLE